MTMINPHQALLLGMPEGTKRSAYTFQLLSHVAGNCGPPKDNCLPQPLEMRQPKAACIISHWSQDCMEPACARPVNHNPDFLKHAAPRTYISGCTQCAGSMHFRVTLAEFLQGLRKSLQRGHFWDVQEGYCIPERGQQCHTAALECPPACLCPHHPIESPALQQPGRLGCEPLQVLLMPLQQGEHI